MALARPRGRSFGSRPSPGPRSGVLEDVPDHLQAEIDEFFATYKNLEAGKEVKTLGWDGRNAALDAISHSQELYAEKFD